MKKLIIGLALAASFMLPASVAGAAPACVVGGSIVYCDTFGHGHTLAQMQTYCANVRPGSAAYNYYNCDVWLAE